MKIYNTMTRQKEEFRPLGKPVKMYVCGVTPYDAVHVGHAMSYIAFDVIRRYLEYRGYRVKYVQNFTDVDDKIIARARQLGVSPDELAEKYINDYFTDMDALNIKRADVYPKVTQEIDAIIHLIEGLLTKGHAYVANGDVYFAVNSDPDYGKLSGRPLDELVSGARVEVDARKASPADFVLWKAAKQGEPAWKSPWGMGRPGWHIECSAMSLKYLGEQIDIHGGGQDLIFPHHENELAQTESYTGVVPFVGYWVHNALLRLGEEKMSKSLGNLVTVKESLQRFSPDALRLFVLSSHYRSPIVYSDEAVIAAERGIERLRAVVRDMAASPSDLSPSPVTVIAQETRQRFVAAMDDDFNTAAAIGHLFDLAREINRAAEQGAPKESLAEAQSTLRELASVLGLTLTEPTSARDLAAKPLIELLIAVRADLRSAKQWASADKIRSQLAELGIQLEDRPDGTTWHRLR